MRLRADKSRRRALWKVRLLRNLKLGEVVHGRDSIITCEPGMAARLIRMKLAELAPKGAAKEIR